MNLANRGERESAGEALGDIRRGRYDRLSVTGGVPFSFRKERSERRVFALFHFVCILFLYLYCVSIDFCATERILFCLNPPLPQRQFPKFQFSKKKQKTKRPKKQLCQDFASPPLPQWSVQNCCFFGLLEIGMFFLTFGKLEFGIFDVLGYFKFSILLEVDNTPTFPQFQNSL